jgi:uncharacterized protein (DUF302 family)
MIMPNLLRTVLHTPFEDALARTTLALKSEGFGVLTDIDVQETLRQKVGAELLRYRILGACNPPFAYRALQLNPDAGLMMPCNVVVHEGEHGEVVVSAVDPSAAAAGFGDPALEALAVSVREKLARAFALLNAAA